MEPNKPQPWYNDGDKVGGLAATLIVLIVIGFLGALAVWLVLKLFSI